MRLQVRVQLDLEFKDDYKTFLVRCARRLKEQ
jgi:hypothetical protein